MHRDTRSPRCGDSTPPLTDSICVRQATTRFGMEQCHADEQQRHSPVRLLYDSVSHACTDSSEGGYNLAATNKATTYNNAVAPSIGRAAQRRTDKIRG